jgi:hypothetical protein
VRSFPPDLRRTVEAGLTVAEFARQRRIGKDKVRALIARGELVAVNVAINLCGRPRWVLLPDAVAAFDRRRSSAPMPKPARRRKRTQEIDFYPD